MTNKLILVACALLAAGLTYAGAVECFEYTGILWIAMTWFGGLFTATLAKLIGEDC